MRWISMALVLVLVGCGGQDAPDKGDGMGDGMGQFAAAQKALDGVAAQHANVKRLTLHAVPAGKTECMQIASTMAARRGKPSDPEDLKAMKTGELIVLDEPEAVDVTVPILMTDGKPTAIAGVTVAMKEGDDRDALVKEAQAVAAELEKAVQAAGKPLW
jgi:hypothetical protein